MTDAIIIGGGVIGLSIARELSSSGKETIILEKNDLNLKSINLKIKTLLLETRDQIKLKGSQVNEINTRGNFVKKISDFLQDNQNIKFKLEVVSLRDSKTAEPIVVEINILKLET